MPPPPLRLRHRDMLRALDGFDPIDVVARELIGRATGEPRGLGERVTVVVATDTTTVKDRETGRVCLLLTPSLHMATLAALSTVAVRGLLAPAVVTAAVFGEGPAARLHLSLLARHVPNVSGASVHPGVLEPGGEVRADVERSGAVLSTDTDLGDAARGANLLVVAELGWGGLDIGRLQPGVVVVNATRRDLPAAVLSGADRVYVDDLGLVEHNQHRAFVRAHLEAGPRGRRIAADLGHVLAGGAGPGGVDDIVLVELFGGGASAARLAAHIYLAAVALGLDHQ